MDRVCANLGRNKVVIKVIEVDHDLDEPCREFDPNQVGIQKVLVNPTHNVKDLVTSQARHVGACDNFNLFK